MGAALPVPEALRRAWEARREALPGRRLPWLEALRRQAWEAFLDRGLPSPREEAWRYTRLQPLARRGFLPGPGEGPEAAPAPPGGWGAAWGLPGAAALVFLDGRPVAREGALPRGLRLEPLGRALEGPEEEGLAHRLGAVLDEEALGGRPFAALNTALFEDGAWVEAAPGAEAPEGPEGTLLLVHLYGPGLGGRMLHPRSLLRVGAGARLAVAELHLPLDGEVDGEGGPEGAGQVPALLNPWTEILLEEGAALSHLRLRAGLPGAFHLGGVQLRQARHSAYRGLLLELGAPGRGAALERLELGARLAGEGARCELGGLLLAGGGARQDLLLGVAHAAPRCLSRQRVKGVLDGQARAAFTGQVLVAPGAAGSDARQACHHLLLSPRAEGDARPELEIHTDEVQCAHGATVGPPDEEALFYLRSRGLDPASALSLLVHGFVRELLAEVHPAGLRRRALGEVLARLPGGGGEAAGLLLEGEAA